MSVRRAGAQNRVRAKSAGGSARGMCLLLESGDQNGNKVSCDGNKASSPDSARSSSSLSSSSSRESPADVEMLDCCLSKEVPAESFGPAPFRGLGQGEGVARLQSGGNSTSLYLDAKPDNWNDNLALVMTSICHGEASDRSDADASPDSEPAVPSRRGSRDDGRASVTSVSSGEMVLRKNSLSLHDSGSDKALSVSVLGDSAGPPPAPSEIGTSSTTLPDVCDGLREKKQKAGVTGDDLDSQNGRIVFFPQRSGEDTYSAGDESPLGLPLEFEGEDGRSTDAALILTERDCTPPAPLYQTYIESDPGACTSTEGATFLFLGSEDSDTSCSTQTSTPVASAINKTFCVPSLSESPCQGDRGAVSSPAVRALKGRSVPSSPAGLKKPASAANKHAKRFPQADFKNVKSKIMSRPTTPLTASNSARVTTTPSKPALANRNTPAASPVQGKGEAGYGNKRHWSSMNQNKGMIPKPRPRRISDCDSALKPKPRKDASLQREGQSDGGSSVNNVTFSTMAAPSEQGHQKKLVQGDDALGGKLRPSEADPGENGTGAKLCAENQEVTSVSVAASEGGKCRLGQRPSPGRARGSSSYQTPAADLRLPPPVTRLSTSSKDGRTSGSMSASRTKHTPATGNQKMRLTERPSVVAVITPGAKPTMGPGLAGPRPAGGSRLPVKSQDYGEPRLTTGSTQASVPAVCRPDGKPARPVASGGPAARLSPQRKALTAGIKNAALPNQTASQSTASLLLRSGSARFQRPASAPQVDKNKPRAGPRTQPPTRTHGQPDLLPTESKPPGAEHYRAQCENNNKCIQQLKKLLASGNRRFEAIAVVIQHIVSEHDEVVKQKHELSQELVSLRGELVTSATSCDALEREKDELRVAFEGVMQKVQEQHQSDLADLEDRLKTFYQDEWEKVHQAYQEEADRCKSQMQQQLDDLKTKHEALRKELEASHAGRLESLKQHYETTLEELRKTHKEEVETLDKTMKEAKAKLTEQIEELSTENVALNEKLNAEEERRRMLAEKNQKDSHTLYLEQELESLKVVLDIKNKQLHQQDKKLMQMDKLMEKSVKLDECRKKVQQENEDLKARMDRHAAMSRQLSTEQAVLQESLQKESKVNKRLSMENEELLWKLHNGDLSSPNKLSPTSPSRPFPSPRNSGVFTSPPVSPR
ncbi:hypothetical protein SKAU_G00038970 [Synaphobranchus kaupii]|uniref:Microtubule-associated tumor suppressor 1 n=1 Tax=Synaphobranchus kaupii TaxID=118154 RepID=A0A9Q1GFB4_SYNKA|nr:hypothetical protein SKAU_G00038970 [Synaphobranchus kaupii]